MGRQKAVIKARREAKRVLRRDSRSHKQREEESVTSLVQMSGVEAIGMARDSRDTSPILARNEAQLHYLKAIESKQLIFATGEAGCGKTWISAAKAAEALIHKDVDRIIVTRPVLQADEDLGFLPGDITEKFAKNAQILQIDIDPAEMNKNVLIDHGIVGDLKEVLMRLNAAICGIIWAATDG